MRNIDLFDGYLNEQLSDEERVHFENALRSDEVFANAFNEHKELINTLKQNNETQKLKDKLKEVHSKEFGSDARIISINKKETFIKQYGKTAMIAACTAIIVIMSAIAIISPGVQKKSNQITELGLIQEAINHGIVEGIKEGRHKVTYAPANIEGSAFALNNAGYILTSYHMIKNADSVFIENNTLQRTLTRVIITDPKLDFAILKIEDNDVIKGWQIPFSFTAKNADIGEKVFTLGYPRKDMVYGEGSLSSLSGFSNDTSMYQISIPVNPGNSGGPLLDEQGNIIGVIRGKISNAEATGFAIKSLEIIKSINTLSTDSIKVVTSKKPILKGLKRTEQIKRINPYVFNVLVY